MLLLAVLTIALAIQPISQTAPYTNSVAMRDYLSERGIGIDSHRGIRGNAFVIDSTREAHKHVAANGRLPTLRLVSSEEITMQIDQVRQFVELLHDRRTYMPDLYKLCVPRHELGITLVSAKGYTEFLFCLHCDTMTVVDEKEGYGINIDGAHNELLAFFRKAFPRNKDIQGLRRHKVKASLKAETAIEWAEDAIPDDPLLKRVKAMKKEELTFELLEELANKATFRVRGGTR